MNTTCLVRDIPIIFSAPMIRALLDGRKSQTRRLAWHDPKPVVAHTNKPPKRSRPLELATTWQKVKPGDRLYVREAWKPHSIYAALKPREIPKSTVFYAADEQYAPSNTPWVPSIHMPRWASRLTLVVTGTKIERLNDITDEDAIAEGVESGLGLDSCRWRDYRYDDLNEGWQPNPRDGFGSLWTSLHGPGSWSANPEVCVISFRAIRKNIDQLTRAA